MGYEIKLIIGSTDHVEGEDNYFMKYAEIDLCKIGMNSKLNDLEMFNRSDKTTWYFYADDGNTKVTEDCYGDKFKALPLSDYIEKLQEDVVDSDYRRFKWALSLLKSMSYDKEPKYVIAYGH